MNKIENRILENQKTIMYALYQSHFKLHNKEICEDLYRGIKKTNKLMETEERSF